MLLRDCISKFQKSSIHVSSRHYKARFSVVRSEHVQDLLYSLTARSCSNPVWSSNMLLKSEQSELERTGFMTRTVLLHLIRKWGSHPVRQSWLNYSPEKIGHVEGLLPLMQGYNFLMSTSLLDTGRSAGRRVTREKVQNVVRLRRSKNRSPRPYILFQSSYNNALSRYSCWCSNISGEGTTVQSKS